MGEPRLLRGWVNFGGAESGHRRVSDGKEVCCDCGEEEPPGGHRKAVGKKLV